MKLGIHSVSGWMYVVYRNQDAAAYLFFYFSISLSLSNFQTLNYTFRHTFLSHREKS